MQEPSATNLGHGAVVWDASVVFAKYMESNAKEFDPAKLNKKTVIELGMSDVIQRWQCIHLTYAMYLHANYRLRVWSCWPFIYVTRCRSGLDR